MLLTVAFWLAFTVLMALMQGLLLPTLRLTPPGKEADTHDLALHKVGLVAYFLPVALTLTWGAFVIAALTRFALFDAVANAASGTQLFYVGNTAKSDKFLRWVSGKTGVPVTYLSAVLKGIALCVLMWIIWHKLLINN